MEFNPKIPNLKFLFFRLDFFVGEKCFIRDLDEPMESGQNPKSQHRPQMMRKNQNYHIFLIVPSVKFYVEFIDIELAPFMFEKSIPDFYGLFLVKLCKIKQKLILKY